MYKYEEYTVALDAKTGKKISAWAGHRFRAYNEKNVHQFKVQGDLNENSAVVRAIKIWRQTSNVKRKL